jgi:acyl phosphate:glycerol-3-phosphate acyltransferase
MTFLIFGLIAYILGSIPTAVWVGKRFYKIDVREHGSKNGGATNTFRVLGKKPGIIVLLVDVIKGIVAVAIPYFFITGDANLIINTQLISAIAAILGHVFPLFANFKGGKGVATSLGVVIGIHPQAAGICLLIFMLVFLVFNYVSLGAMVSAIFFPLLIEFVFENDFIWLRIFSIVLAVAVVATHNKNIVRLMNGNENKMNLFKK